MKRLRKPLRPIFYFLLVLAGAAALGSGASVWAQGGPDKGDEEAERHAYFSRIEADILAGLSDPEDPALGATPCVGGFAGPYPCDNVDLMAFMPLSSIGGGSGNDIWGWTDPQDGKEYALMGRSSGTSFVDISDPVNPVYLGDLPTQTSNSSWRDIKVYNDYAFIVSEAGGHGIQIFDLTRLRNVINPPVTFTVDAHYNAFGSAHNIAINEDSGYAYGVGTGTCSGGLHMVNIQNPISPTNAGCYSGDGYTHDAQCIIYSGPDPDYQGDEICFGYNEDTLTIVDVTNKAAPALVSRTGYSGASYTHQGWISPDHTYVLLGDELDESSFGHNTRTRIWDVSDLDAPLVIDFHDGPNPSIDHNLYIHDGYAYESNYTSGLQILDMVDVAQGNLAMVAYFDTYTPSNSTSFNGTWSNYPYFDSGIVVVSGIGEGLFILQPTLAPDYTINVDDASLEVCVAGETGTTVNLVPQSGYTGTVDLSAVGLPAGSTASFSPPSVSVPGSSGLVVTVSTTLPGDYPFDVHGDDGTIQHDKAMSLSVLSGAPAAPGLVFPANGQFDVAPDVTFTWDPSAEATGYAFELATDAGMANVIDSATTSGTSHQVGVGLDPLTTYYWQVTPSNLCGDGAPSLVFSFTTRDIPPVLLVDDDDNGPDVRSYYTDALDALGFSYDVFDTGNSDNEPGSGLMAAYDAVVWFSGDEFNEHAGPGAAGEAALAAYLDGGGCLFISSQDYHYDKGLTGFMTGYLGVASVTNDDGNYTSVDGQNVFAGFGPYTLAYPFSDFSDPLTVGNGGMSAMLGNNGKVGGTTKETAEYRTSFWAFPWEALPEAGREATLGVLLDWCGVGQPEPPGFMLYLPVVNREP